MAKVGGSRPAPKVNAAAALQARALATAQLRAEIHEFSQKMTAIQKRLCFMQCSPIRKMPK